MYFPTSFTSRAIHRSYQLGAAAMIIACLSLQTVAAEVYRWVDDEGNTHYSDSPVKGQKSTVVEPPVINSLGNDAQFHPENIRQKQLKREYEAARSTRLKKEKAAQKKAEAGQTLLDALAWQKQHCKQVGGEMRNANGSMRTVPISFECPKNMPKKYKKALKQLDR